VQYRLLPSILEHEGAQFYNVTQKWQPKSLIPDPYRRSLLKDAQRRFKTLSEAEDELKALDRAPLYMQILRRMRFTVRAAQFAWRFDDLKFLESISSFFTDYGTVLRYLRYDRARGRLDNAES
jgi:hypothetical protein